MNAHASAIAKASELGKALVDAELDVTLAEGEEPPAGSRVSLGVSPAKLRELVDRAGKAVASKATERLRADVTIHRNLSKPAGRGFKPAHINVTVSREAPRSRK